MTGKTCLITGANGGIGYETARALAKKGARIVMVARNEQRGAARPAAHRFRDRGNLAAPPAPP